MPSEAQSREPRDRGPAPPITRAGRSAQLAKAAASNSGPERRSRGRPRKDGSGGRTAPPASPPPPPPPTQPPPKSRKKGRSRGRAQVEDEESMDASEKKRPQKTDVKEVKEVKGVKEKTTGRRRSTSRKKPNANPEPDPDPEPSQDCLSPEPEVDPDTDFSHSTVPESNPEPLPRAEEVDRTSPPPAALLPEPSPRPPSSPREEPCVSPLPLCPGHSPASSPRPAPDPIEEVRLSPSHSPAPMKMECSPSMVPMETEGGRSSPRVQSPALSSCFSPPVSPCLRLEDENSLSPLFQRCLSEDSGSSPTPSFGHTKKRLKQCAFCYRGDGPPLGQGRLVVFGPTPGYIPLHILNRRTSPDRDNDCHDYCYRSDQAPPTSPEQCEEESSSEFVEQLGPVGLPHDINVQSLFDPTGQCCAHLQCAAWSEGVRRGEGQSLLYVDKAIDSGSTQVCAFCRRLGASLCCREASCRRSYHFPCAAAAGAHQDWSQTRTLCTRHKQTASSQCVLCLGGGDVSLLLMCCRCGNCYHSSCLDPPLSPSPLLRAGWQCPQCQVCQSCRLRGDDGILLVCERCDKAYHTHCLTPPLDHTPSTAWSCKNCRICRRCGVRSSGQWANHPFLCESCDPALPCSLCDHSPDLYTPQDYLTCVCCYRCVHTECVVQAGEGRAGSEDYVCSTCRPQEEELITHTSNPPGSTLALPLSPTATVSIKQPQSEGQTVMPPISHTAHSPVQLIFSEPPRSPSMSHCTPSKQSLTPSHPERPELQHSPAPSHPEPTEIQHSPAPCHPEPTELQHSPAPCHPEHTELHHSPEPKELQHSPEPTEIQHSPAPCHPEPTERQHSPEPTELQHSPAPCHPEPTELQHSPAPCHPEPTELQHSPTPCHPEPTERQHSPEPTELQHSPEPTELPHSPEPTEIQHSPAPCDPEPTELQHSPAPCHPEPTELQHSHAPCHPEPTERQHSPEPTELQHSPEPTELQHCPAPCDPETTEFQHRPASFDPDPTDIQHGPSESQPEPAELPHGQAPFHSEPTELKHSPAPCDAEHTALQHSPAPCDPEHTELQLSPAPCDPEHTELQLSPAPCDPERTKLQHSPAPSNLEHTEFQHSPAPSNLEPTEIQHKPAPSHPELKELQHRPAPCDPEQTKLQHSPAPCDPEPTELQHSPGPSHTEPTELQHSPAPCDPEPTMLQHSPAPCDPDLTELQQTPAPCDPEPTKLQHSPAPCDPEPTELQHSPAPCHPEATELQHSPAPCHPEATELQRSPAPCDPTSTEIQHSPAPCDPEPTEILHSPAPCDPEPKQLQLSPAPCIPEPTELRQSPASCDPEPTELQHSPEPTELQHSPAPCDPEPTELQHIPAPCDPEPTELQHSPEPTELQHSPAPCDPEPTEVQQSPAPCDPEPTELQHSPAPCILEPTELRQSPASCVPEPTELQHSPEPTELQHSPEPTELQHSPEPTEIQHSPAPCDPEPTELQHSPALCDPEPTELKHSSAPCDPEPTELQHSPATCDPEPTELQHSLEPTELQHSPAPSDPEPTELQHSPALCDPEPTELQHSPASCDPEPTEHQHSPAPCDPEPTELQHTPEPTELKHSPALCDPEPTELQHSPAPCDLEPTELQHSPAPCDQEPTELQQSPAPCHPEATELQHSPAPCDPEPIELQHSPAPSDHEPTELQHSPAPSDHEPTELQHSLAPCDPESTELQQSPAPCDPEPTELQHSPAPCDPEPIELQHSPAPSDHEPTELQHSPAPCDPEPMKLQHIPLLTHPEPIELQESPALSRSESKTLHCSPAPSQSELSELHLSSVQSQPDPAEFEQLPTLPHSNSKQHQQSPLPSDLEPSELETSTVVDPAPLPQSPAQSATNPAELQENHAAIHSDPTVNREHTQLHLSPAELPQSATKPQPSPLECLGSPLQGPTALAELHQIPIHVTLMQAQHSPHLHSCTSASHTQNSPEDEFMVTEPQKSPTQGSPMALRHARSPHSQTQAGLSPAEPEQSPSEPEQSPSEHNLVLGFPTQAQVEQPCTTTIITRIQHSPIPHSPAQVSTSQPQSSTEDSKPSLYQESPGSSSPAQLLFEAAQNISTLDQDCSQVYCRSTQAFRRDVSLKPMSAPCSPLQTPIRATVCSLSQPASPTQTHPSHFNLLSSLLATQSRVTKECIRTSASELKSSERSPLNLEGQTLESSPAPLSPSSHLSPKPLGSHGMEVELPNQVIPVQSSVLNLGHSSPTHIPAIPMPESLAHIHTLIEHRVLPFSHSAKETEKITSPTSPSLSTESKEANTDLIHIQNSSASSSPKHADQMPTSPASSHLACASPTEPSPAHASNSEQLIDPLAPPVGSSMQVGSPSEVAAGHTQPIPCQEEEIETAVEHSNVCSDISPSNPTSPTDSPVHTIFIQDSPVHTEASSGYSRIQAREKTCPSICSSAELTHTSQSPTHAGQSSPSHVQPTCSPSPTSPVRRSPLPPPASFSPPHCRPTSPARSAVSHSLSQDGQTGSCSVSKTDVGVIQSPSRSSHAGQASPFDLESTSSDDHLGPVQIETLSSADTAYSSPVYSTAACVNPCHSPPQASETYQSPSLNTGTSCGSVEAQPSPSLANSKIEVDMEASAIPLSPSLPNVVQIEYGLSKSPDSIQQMSPIPPSSLPDDSSLSTNQVSLSHAHQTTASSPHTSDRSAENKQSTAPGSPSYQRSPTSVDATSTQACWGSTSPVHSNPTQDDTAMPGTSHTSEMAASPLPSPPSQVSLPQTLSPQAPQTQASSVQSSPVASPVGGPSLSGDTPAPNSPVQLEARTSPAIPSPAIPSPAIPSPESGSPIRCEANSGPDSVVILEQSQNIRSPGPRSPVQPDAGPCPGSPSVSNQQQRKQTERESTTAFAICLAEVEEETVPQKTTQEETEKEALQQVDLQDTIKTIKESQEDEEEPFERTEVRVKPEQEREEQHHTSSCHSTGLQLGSVLIEDHESPPHTAVASPLPQLAPSSSQAITPLQSALQPSPSCSAPASPFISPESPPSFPSRAGSPGASPSSPSHRTALHPSSSPITQPPSSLLQDSTQEEELSNQGKAEMGQEDKVAQENRTISCHVRLAGVDGQSERPIEPVAVATELTKDKNQSHAEPSEREEGETLESISSNVAAALDVVAMQQPLRVGQDAEEEEQGEGGTSGFDEEEVDATWVGPGQEDPSDVEEAEPVSPVLELDPSLDMEVMELMTSSSPPPSLLHLSTPSPPPFSRRGKGRTLRPPPCSSRPSDDLSIRLRQSPFSTEASPETSPARTPITPPPLSPPSPPFRSSPFARESPPLSKAPPITVLPLTPKIGMGKPAISKRKFSPGRARIKQGSCWSNRRAVSPPSSSQDSMGEGGWDSPKPRPQDSPLWSMRVGCGSGFPGRRRSRGGGIGGGRGARGRSRLKTQDCLAVSPGCVYVEPFQPKEEEENSMHNTVVMFSTSDHFTLRQDMCVVCGSFGQGAEGRLLACSQCGQCYHPYCVNVKITRVILTKGWRCLECTVCEACGEASDPGRLLLCDDCDISYHTYCLDPPLHTVPKGSWKCKWCVWCVRCGSSSPGLHCDWQSNYSLCGPCDSLRRCPLCQRQYSQDDLIMQCQQCDRWVHAVCQGLTSEEEVEVAADEGFDCSLCRTHGRGTCVRSDSLEAPYMAQIITRIREPGRSDSLLKHSNANMSDAKTYTQDGVCLTESGLSHLQSLVEPLTSPRRYRRCKPKLKLRIINQNSVSVLQTPPEPDAPTEQDHSRGDLECELKSDSSPERDQGHDDDVTKEPEVTDGNKKRKRKPYRPGIGGFMVRQRGGKTGPSRIKLCRKDSTEILRGRDEDLTIDALPPAEQAMEKVKKRYRKKKTKLEEAFPSYLQDAFFGRDLLDRSRQVDRRPRPETPGVSQSRVASDGMKVPASGLHGPSTVSYIPMKKQEALPMSEGALLDLSEVLNTDPHILATGHTGQFQVERSPSPFAGLDIDSMTEDPSLTGHGGHGQRTVQEEHLDAILSPELDKMVTDGAILGKLYKIPELEGKDVEEVFTAVLSPNSSNNQPEQSQHVNAAAGSKTHIHHTAAAAFPRLPLMNGLMGTPPQFPNTSMIPGGTQGPAGLRLPLPEGSTPSPLPGTAPSGMAPANRAPAGEGEQDGMSTAQRSMLKWEKEETLGEMATVAPVLYCNTNFPQLKDQYPDWSTRVKQIAKLWRKASSQDRAPFVQKARDNRAAQRINKVQLSNDPLKRHQPLQLPLPGPYDPVSVETEGPFKDQLRPKETEQEQEWKLRQQMRQISKQQAKIEATQKLEQVKNEQLLQQRQQQMLASQRIAGHLSPETGSRSPLTPTQQPVAPGNASPLHPGASREGPPKQHHLMQGLQSAGLTDDGFLRPQAPPPSGFSSLPHSPHSSSPLHQPPSSPQMFSPPSSRPSSPWDPYSKVVGTPRPTSSQAGGLSAPQQQRRNSLSSSPANDGFGSPIPSPDSKTSEMSRALIPQPGLQQCRAGMMSPPSGSAPDHLSRHVGIRAAENYQRTSHNSGNVRVAASELYIRAGELFQGGLFKAPMPPQQQPQPEAFGSTGGGRRDPSRPTDLAFALGQTQDPAFPSSPLSGLGSPHRSPYAQAPGTPRPDYSQQINDPFTQQSSLTSRPSPDPYPNPQTPGTPRPHSDPTYITTPPSLRMDQYNQQSASRRPSPSLPNVDPYSCNPGTPRASISERFPRSPGSQRSNDSYAQPAGALRPSPDPYAQQPSTPRPQKPPEAFNQAPLESFAPHAAGSGSSPLAPALLGETLTFTPTHHQLQQSPGRQQQQDSFPRTPSNQTQKHPGMMEESTFTGLAGQTPGHDHFEPGRETPGPSQTDKSTTNELAALGVASLDGPMSMLPQLGDSEEKLRQRQRLRQLILRQQQQKSALRQEKGLQEAASGPIVPLAAPPGPSPAPAIPCHWSMEDSATASTIDLFGRPPPPYPGTVRPSGVVGAPGPRFPGVFPEEQLRGFTPSEAHFPRHGLQREQGLRAPVLRFGVPPGTPAGLQDSFLRPPQGSVPGSGVIVEEGIPIQIKRQMPGDFTGIRPLHAHNSHMMQGVMQPFLPRSLPPQQHSILGQPYIELRHRAPENRLRLPFQLPTVPDSELVTPGQGPRMGEPPLGQQMVMEQPNQQHIMHTAALTQSCESTLSGADGMEEHLEGEDSAVKDLEDVEVKDLVDLNLNLDHEDGKEDLDLGANDLHLDDFLLSGKFDLIAYADPELNLEDKKDMFNEELDLGEPVEEKDVVSGTRKIDSHTIVIGQIKQEVQNGTMTEVKGGTSATPQTGVVTSSRPPRVETADSSQLGSPVAVPALQTQEHAHSSVVAPRGHPPMAGGQQSVFQQQQRLFGPSPSALFTAHPQGLLVSAQPSLTPQGLPGPLQQMSLQSSQPRLLLTAQTQPPQLGTTTQTQSQAVLDEQNLDPNKLRPLLLEEQPLLLQDLLDQERQEQQQQKQMQALIRQRSPSESVLPNMDFDSISDPIMKAKMVVLKGINKVMTQGNLSLNPIGINRFQQAPVAQDTSAAPGPEGTPPPPPPQLVVQMTTQDRKPNPQLLRPNPPNFGPGFVNESQQRQYEEWLGETQRLLQMQQRLLDDQIAAHRKTKKSLSAKQRTAKKAGRPFAEEDAAQLRHITEQQGTVQKQLEQIRKQQKDHAELIEDYRTKQQKQRALQQQPPAAPAMIAQNLLSQPIGSIPPHPGGATPVRAPNVPPGWTSGGGAPGVIAQRLPPHLPPQMPPALPNTSPVPPHTQTPPAMVAPLVTPTAGFMAGPHGPTVGQTVGPSGAAGDGAAPPRQVNFDDNNPFSEGFQERERRERLREQQERQRVQLMQEVERHRALQQRLELEQQGLLGASMGPGAAVAAIPSSGAPTATRVGLTPGPGSAPVPAGDSLSQMPFFSSELPQDFLQSPPASRPPPQHESQSGSPFPQQGGIHQGFTAGPHHPAQGLLPGATAERGIDMLPSSLQAKPRFSGLPGLLGQEQVRPGGIGAAGTALPHPGNQTLLFGHDSTSSSCSSSRGSASLIQLYSDIIPDDKAKKKRSRKRDGDDTAGGGGSRTPLSCHSDDITAPPTPTFSDTSCSTPTRGNMDHSDLSFPMSSSLCSLAPSSELEKQLSVISAAQQRGSVIGMESQRGPLFAFLEVKKEREEGGACGVGMVKMEESTVEGVSSPSPHHGGDSGKELLRHLLKDKTSPATTPSPTGQIQPIARRQLCNESVRSEEEDRPGSHGNMVNSLDLLDPSGRKKTQRCKRPTKPEKDKAPPKNKRRKKEEEEKLLHTSTSSSSDPLMTHLTQLSVLPLMEPILRVDLSLIPAYGSSSLGRESRLTGSFGNACLDGVTDYYSHLIYKQNNLSNPPTPPASLPPTPPPVARQKLVNGFATTEELSRKEITEQEVKTVKQKGEGLVALNHASKNVDVPASLPTPPHNNQEELRVQDSSERESPDGFVPSSSPESVTDMEVSRYPDFSFIKLEPPSPCPSPPLPIMPSAWGKGSSLKQEVKTEPSHQGPPSCSSTDLVTIAITLNPVAAQNVPSVMAAVAELLRVPVPGDYQLSRPLGPECSSLALLAGVRVPLMQSSTGSRPQRHPPPAGNTGLRMDFQRGATSAVRPQCCSYCKGLLGNGVRIVKDFKQEGPSRPGSSLVFCTTNCSTLYTSDLESRTSGNKAADSVQSGFERIPPSSVQHHYSNNMSSIAVHSLLHTPSSLPTNSSSSPPLAFPSASTITMETRPRMDSLKVKVKLKPRPRAVTGGEDSPTSRHLKRLKSCRWRRWSISITLNRGSGIPNGAIAMPTEEEVDVLLKKLGVCLRPDPLPKDQRRCCFCNQQGDGLTDGPARLLNLDLDLWVHLNCALWSSEVYETQAGALINVELALRRGLTLRCAHCQQTGATSGCNRLRCTNTYHFTCALQAHCTFFKDKTMLCHLHKPRSVPLSGDRSSSCSPSSTPGQTPDPSFMAASDPYDSELRCFAVFRRVFVQRDEARQIAAVVQRGERQHTFRVGSLVFRSVGRLLPHQMTAFHNKTAIFPIGYHANRFYWSMRHSNRRCKYMCYIEDQQSQPLFKVKVVEKGYDDVMLTGPTPKAVWDQILELVSQMRSSSGTLKLFPVYLKGEDLFGLTTSAVTRIVESLPGVEGCERYTFRYGRNPLMEWPLAFNPTGSARSEPKVYQSKRTNLLTSIAPRCQGSVGSIVGVVPGVISLSPGESVAGAHQGRHSKSSQYRRMKAEWKTSVYLARSRIQGLGLYAARDIEKCTMVIEYIGTIIRSEVANRKERLYESQNRGVYMFRIDNDYVIDATITGGPARYINHSCSPNCITEVVTVEKENKIIISSCRRIQRGEELSYDYKFDLEDDQHKIPCHCGAVNCRKWMN